MNVDEFYDAWEFVKDSGNWPLKELVLKAGFELGCVNIQHTPVTREREYDVIPISVDIKSRVDIGNLGHGISLDGSVKVDDRFDLYRRSDGGDEKFMCGVISRRCCADPMLILFRHSEGFYISCETCEVDTDTMPSVDEAIREFNNGNFSELDC